MADSVLRVSVLGDISDLQKKLDQAGKATGGFGDKMNKTAKLIGGALGGAAVAAFGKAAVEAFTEAEKAQAQLNKALANSTVTVGVTAKAFEAYNKTLAKTVLADDDAIAAGQAVLVSFGLTETQLKKITPVVLDYAAKTGKAIPEAAEAIGKALLGQGRALKDVGVEWVDTGSLAGNYAQVMTILEPKVRGFAQAQLDAASPGEKLNKSLDELKETVGAKLVPALQALADWGIKASDWFSKHPEAVVMAGAIGTLAVAVWGINTAVKAWTATQLALNTQLLVTLGRVGAGALAGVLGAGAVVGFGAVDLGKDLAKDAGGWKGKLNQILGGGGDKGLFGKNFLGIDKPAIAAATGAVTAGIDSITGAVVENMPAVDAMAGANVKAAASLATLGDAVETLKTKDLSAWAKGVQKSIEGALDPTKRAAVDPDTTFAALQKNMAGNVGDVVAWQKDLEALSDRGFPILAGELAKLGPGAAKAVDEATRVSKPALQKMQDAFVTRAKMISDATVLTLESELGGKLGPTLTRLGADAAAFFGKGWATGITGIGTDTGNILAGIAAPRTPVLAAPAPTGGLLGAAPTTNNVTVNVASPVVDPVGIAKNIVWELN